MEASEGKTATIALSAWCLTKPYFSVLTTTPNNWRERLMGQIPTLGTPFRRKKTTIKRGKRETKWRILPSQHTREARKSSSDHAEDQFPLVNSAQEKHRDDRCSYTKTQLFGPLSTNLLYQAHWFKVPCILGLAWKTWPYRKVMMLCITITFKIIFF